MNFKFQGIFAEADRISQLPDHQLEGKQLEGKRGRGGCRSRNPSIVLEDAKLLMGLSEGNWCLWKGTCYYWEHLSFCQGLVKGSTVYPVYICVQSQMKECSGKPWATHSRALGTGYTYHLLHLLLINNILFHSSN